MKKKTYIHFLVSVLLLCFCLDANAQDKNKRINLTVSEEALPTALRRIERLSGYYKINFSYEQSVQYKVTAEIKNKTVPEAVSILLRGLPYTSSIDGHYIQVKCTARQTRRTPIKNINGLTGRITDNNGEPLIGATIRVVGKNLGTVTDNDGRFNISGANPDDEVEISYIGRKTIRRKSGSKPLNIILSEDLNLLDDVMVTGYQSIKREDATGAFDKITSRDLEQRTTTDLLTNLEGLVPGLTIYSNGLNDEGENTISIRGISTFRARSNPLVVVDGLPIEGSIETVNPYDIASIDVLKDAAATALYGARASNGVIVITTKKAKKMRKTDISFTADLTIAKKQTYDNYNYVNASDAVDAEIMNMDAVFANATGAMYESYYWPAYQAYYSPVALLYMQHREGTVSDSEYDNALNNYRQNDFVKYYRDHALRSKITQQYNIAVRNKTEKSNNSLVANYKGDNQAFVKEYNRTFNVSFKEEYDITKWLKATAGINVDYNSRKNHYEPSTLSFLSSPYSFPVYSEGTGYLKASPVDPDDAMFSDQSLGFKSLHYNLDEQLGYNFKKASTTNTRMYLHLDFNILPCLNFSTQFQHEKNQYKSEAYLEKGSYAMNFIYDLYTSGGIHLLPDAGIMDTANREGNYLSWRNQVNFNKELGGKHAVSALAGMELRQTKYRTTTSKYIGYDDATQTNYMSTLNLYTVANTASSDLFASLGRIAPRNYYNLLYTDGQPGTGGAYSTSDITHRYASFYFSANYTYDHRYAASMSIREDKTDLFGAEPKFRGTPLWSTGLSWNMHNESFLKGVKAVDVLKLRLSYGVTGNIDSSVSSYLVGRITSSALTGGKYAYLSTPPNDDLKWEKTTSWDFGVDYSLLGNTLRGSIDLYRKYSSDILSNTALDPSEGFTSLVINNGEASNKGIEAQINATVLKARSTREVGIDLGFNFAYNKNKVEKVTYEPDALTLLGWGQSSHALVVGNAINSLYAIRYAGHDEDGKTQWYKADGTATTEYVYSGVKTEDVVCMGTLDPKYTIDFTPTISYRGFSLSAMFSYYGGHVMRANISDWINSSSLTGFGNSLQSMYQYLTLPDTYTLPYPSVDNYLTSYNTGQALMYFDGAVVPADYMKLRNIVLSYNIPHSLCRKLGIGSARLRLQVNNVAKWVRNDLGVDPEANNPWTGYTLNKPVRSYTMSLNVNF